MKRPGRSYSMDYPPTPCSDNSDRKPHILNDVELKERSSKSLLANVLDIDDDFRHNCRPLTPGGTLPPNPAYFRTVFGYVKKKKKKNLNYLSTILIFVYFFSLQYFLNFLQINKL